MSAIDVRILLFARSPVPGQVKTRLIPALGEQGAAQLHAQMVQHCVAQAVKAGLGPVELWCSPTAQDPLFTDCHSSLGITLHDQQGEDLGQRMQHALTCALKDSEYAILTGSDCPAINKDYLAAALRSLAAGHDAVLGPAEDGGYVLIGVRRSLARGLAALFSNMQWGTATVLSKTCERLDAGHWRWKLLEMSWDVDRPEDLNRLQEIVLVGAAGA